MSAVDHHADSTSARSTWPWLAGVLLATTVVYWASLDNQLTNWDDNDYVTGNPYFGRLDWTDVRVLFTTFFKGNYHPLTMLSLTLDHLVGGGDPRIHHVVNLLLHLGSTLLVYLGVRALLGRPAVAVATAALFALHPMHVESVVWVSERKDVLAALFYLASLLAYVRFARAPAGQRALPYVLSLDLFVLALLSKGTAVALAPTLVAVDALLGRRPLAARTLLEKAPFLVLALVFGIVALIAQASVGQLQGESPWTGFERVLLACHALVQYVVLLLVPHGLSAFYPYPERISGGLPPALWGDLALVIGLGCVFLWSIRRQPVLAFGIGFFVINVALVLQLIPVGGAILADRYSYLPSIGLSLVLAHFASRIARRGRPLAVAVVLVGLLYVGVLATATHARSLVWRDSVTLWSDTLARHPDVPSARMNRALALIEQGDLAGAEADLDAAIRIAPKDARAHAHRGIVRYRAGHTDAALRDLDRALVLSPSAEIYANRGAVRLATGDTRAAIADFDRAIALAPGHAVALNNRGIARASLGDHAAALRDFVAASRASPGYAQPRVGSGEARLALGETLRALDDFEAALAIDPRHGGARLGRGRVLLALGRVGEACSELRLAAQAGAPGAHETLVLHCGG